MCDDIEKPVKLTAEDVKVGHCYRAKRPGTVALSFTQRATNDRQVTYVSPSKTQVQYDSPSVRSGAKYPLIAMEKFLAWAAYDCTNEMPASDEWETRGLSPEQRAKCRDALKIEKEDHR